MATFYGLPDNRTREVITGSDGDDLIYPLGGWDVVQGRGGIDSVFVYGEAAGFTVMTEQGITYIDALSGASAGAERAQLYDVERIVFLDEVVDLTLPGSFVGRDGGDIFVGGAGRDTATWAAPRGQFRIERVGDLQTQTEVDALAARLLREARTYYQTATVRVFPDTDFSVHEVVDLSLTGELAALNGRWWVRRWALGLTPASCYYDLELNRVTTASGGVL
jgi:hypothetical protein